MEIKVIARGLNDAADLREFGAGKLAGALERFEDRVLTATMRLEDETGPTKRGIDKVCSIEVRLRTGEIRIREVGEEFRATIDTAVDRLKGVLSREVGKAKRGVGEG